MKHGHLTPKVVNDFMDGLCNTGENIEIEKHLEDCSRCRQLLDEYRLVIKEIKKTDIYEPVGNFEALVTQNLPDIYPGKHSAFYEIVSMIMILIPFCSAIGYFIYTKSFNPVSNIINTGGVIIDSLLGFLKNIRFLHDNAEILGLLMFYMFVFIIFDRFFTRSRLVNFKTRILKSLFFMVNRLLPGN